MRTLDRDILRLALPALGALAAEPVFLIADTIMVGHLGPDALGSLAIAGAVLQTVLGLMIFLAYATTPRVARHLGAGDRRAAVSAGFDGMWLALIVALILLAAGLPFLSSAIAAFNPTAEVAAGAHAYLTISWWGLPLMLIVIAATGLLRGQQDTRTPLLVAAAGFGLNIVFNAGFIYGLNMGVAGSALGSVAAHGIMCLTYLVIAVRAARRHGASLLPQFGGVLSSARASGWLLLRNIGLRIALLVLVAVGTSLGTVELAALHIALTLFNSLALVLDSIAIAGQAMIGLHLGKRDRAMVAAINRRLIQWGIGFGVIVGIALAAASPVLGRAFTADQQVGGQVTALALILATGLPLAGYVFTLDGVLMGASDTRYLALAQVAAAAGFCVLAYVSLSRLSSIAVLWAAFCWGFMAFRGLGLGLRMRGQGWIIRAENASV